MQPRKRHEAITVFALFLTFLLASAVAARPAQAQTFKVLHAFHSGKGPQYPSGQLVLDAGGKLYGIAADGGSFLCGNFGCGAVFKMTETGKLVWVYSFKGVNGEAPIEGLLRDAAGNLFGVTLYGGTINNTCGGVQAGGCGLVFELDKTGKRETVLHKFNGTPDGYFPETMLVEDSVGTLYGTTSWGGTAVFGTVFKIGRTGKDTEKILYNFEAQADGGIPGVGVIRDSAENLYGTTSRGGDTNCSPPQGCGNVYKLDSTGKEAVLYDFTGRTDGWIPSSSVIWDKQGNLYGETAYGGSSQDYWCAGQGCGVVYKLSPNSNGSWTETTLYSFCSQSNCTDGQTPLGGLVRDPAGNLYGVTEGGGENGSNCNGGTCGVVFKVDTSGKETVLHMFTGGTDGAFPQWGLVMDGSGNLYGVTQEGGDLTCGADLLVKGCGVVFKITP
jgi:uncharacterized repeat protein (TIGR03803 family)